MFCLFNVNELGNCKPLTKTDCGKGGASKQRALIINQNVMCVGNKLSLASVSVLEQ